MDKAHIFEVTQSRPVSPKTALPGWSVATFAVCLLSITGPVAKHLSLDGLALSFHRFFWLALALSLVMAIRGKRITLTALRWSWFPGLLFAINIAMFFTAVKLTTIANATILGALQPAMSLVLVGPILGERVYRSDRWLALLAMAGVVTVVYGSSTRPEWDFRGDLLSVGAILAWTVYLFATKNARKHLDAIELQTTLTLVAAATALPIALASGQDMGVSGSDWKFLALLALVGGAGHTLVNFAHSNTKLILVSLMFLAVPILSTAWAALFLGESLNIWQIAGMAIVLISLGTIIYTMEHRERY